MPNCSYPPSHRPLYAFNDDAAETAAVETSIEYVFRLGLQNFPIIEVPAGTTVFATAVTPSSQAQAASQVTVELSRPAPRFDDELVDDKNAALARLLQYAIRVNSPPVLVQGHNFSFNISIQSLNTSSALFPSRIFATAWTLPAYRWAASFAAEAGRKLLWLGRDIANVHVHDNLRQHRSESIEAKDLDERNCFVHEIVEFGWDRPPKSAISAPLINENWSDDVKLELVIPLDQLPSHQTTFVDYVSHVAFDLYCVENQESAAFTEDELEAQENDLWTSSPRRETQRFVRFTGRMDTKIYSGPGTKDSAPAWPDYLSGECLAPLLLRNTKLLNDVRPHLPISYQKRQESSSERVLSSKYGYHECGGPSSPRAG